MNINFINFIQEIKSAESNQQQLIDQIESSARNLECIYCQALLIPILATNFVYDCRPSPDTPREIIPLYVYVCLNPNCPLIRSLYRRGSIGNHSINDSSSRNDE